MTDSGYTKIAIEAIIALVAVGAGAYFGATFAYHKERKHKAEEERNRQITGGRRAIFLLGNQINALANYKAKVLDPAKKKPVPWMEMETVNTSTYDDLRHRIEDLEFLLGTKDGDICFNVMIENGRFHTAIEIINLRARYAFEKFQPAIQEALQAEIPMRTAQETENALGSLISGNMKSNTKQVYHHVEATVDSLDIINKRLLKILRKRFPGEIFTFVAGLKDQK